MRGECGIRAHDRLCGGTQPSRLHHTGDTGKGKVCGDPGVDHLTQTYRARLVLKREQRALARHQIGARGGHVAAKSELCEFARNNDPLSGVRPWGWTLVRPLI